MEFQIGENFFVRCDQFNWILEEKVTVSAEKSKNGEASERLVIAGYFGNLDQLANKLIERDLKASDCKTIQELLERLESTKNRLRIEINEKVKDKTKK